uniref:Uncharacterized protein n=1 Tax=Zosterops lateralis melanops TaxID=1220523 RepID=A0A8D2QKK7_ZOSLA
MSPRCPQCVPNVPTVSPGPLGTVSPHLPITPVVSLLSLWCPQCPRGVPRYFHRPADGSEGLFDAVSIMDADILGYCQKEAWCKLAFYLLSFFYYLYR